MSNDAPQGWDDEPSANPQIQKDYEAALGAFLVVFNAIENEMSDIIILALKKAGREEIYGSLNQNGFARKVTTLELLSVAYPQAASQTLLKELRNLAGERNNLAHGHFDQNPLDGSYQIVAGKKVLSVPIEQIVELRKRAEKVWDELRSSAAFFWFDDILEEADTMDETVDLRKSVAANLEQFRKSLRLWETGRLSIADVDPSTGQRHDLTQEHIEHLKRIIAEYEQILAHFDRGNA